MTELRTRHRAGNIDLGLRDERVKLGDHIAYFWENDKQFEEAVGFLLVGIRKGDHAVVFGHDEANKKVVAICCVREGSILITSRRPSA